MQKNSTNKNMKQFEGTCTKIYFGQNIMLLDEPSGSETSNTSAEEEVTDDSEQEDNENKGLEEGSDKEKAQQEEVADAEENDKENTSSEIEIAPSPRDEGEDNVAMESSKTTTSPVDDDGAREEDDDDPFGNTGEDDSSSNQKNPSTLRNVCRVHRKRMIWSMLRQMLI